MSNENLNQAKNVKKDNKIQTVNFNMSKSMYEELKKLYGGAVILSPKGQE